MYFPKSFMTTLLFVLGLLTPIFAGSAPSNEDRLLQIVINKSKVVTLPKKANQILVGNPDIVDIQMIDATHILVLGKSLGSTNVTLGSSATGFYKAMDLEVIHDIEGLKSKLHQLLPNEHPAVFSSQGAIVLSGQISSPEKIDAIMSIANTFVHQGNQSQGQGQGATGGASGAAGAPAAQGQGASAAAKNQQNVVINMMQIGGPQQVMLEVKVAEMNRTLAKNLKVDFNAFQSGSPWAGGAISGRGNVPSPITDYNGNIILPSETVQGTQLFNSLLQAGSSSISPFGLFARLVSKDHQFTAVINAARNNGLVKILAEPTLTTISGQEASFLSGGEFPIPVQRGIQAGSIAIVYKEFGVTTKFIPVVLDSGRISLKLNIEYSELEPSNSVVSSVLSTTSTFVIPSLTTRRANSSVELSDGQTIGIAGLIKDNLRDSINKFPGLGDIPVLGQLFTSQEFLKNQSELVIFVTPRLAKPMPTQHVKLPTDHFVEPNDVEYYLMGRTEGLTRRLPPSGGLKTGGLQGSFGQQQ